MGAQGSQKPGQMGLAQGPSEQAAWCSTQVGMQREHMAGNASQDGLYYQGSDPYKGRCARTTLSERDLNQDVKKCEVREVREKSEAHVSLLLPEPTHRDDRRVRVTPCPGLSSGCMCMARPSVSWGPGKLGVSGANKQLGSMSDVWSRWTHRSVMGACPPEP